jgi:hypothetical protein
MKRAEFGFDRNRKGVEMPAMSKSKRKRAGKETLYVELPEGLRIKARLEALAAEHSRSMTGEAIEALKEYLARHERKDEGSR